jgi:hypothetical protein
LKMTLTMPPRKISQRLSRLGDKALPQTYTQNQPPTQNLSTVVEGQHSRSRVETPNQQQRFHHSNRIKPKWQRCQFNTNQ